MAGGGIADSGAEVIHVGVSVVDDRVAQHKNHASEGADDAGAYENTKERTYTGAVFFFGRV